MSPIEYFNNDRSLPIFSRRTQIRTSSLYTVRAILDTSADLVCTKHPTNINISCTFVVDSGSLLDAEDTKCDDCGTWKQTKTATTDVRINFFENGKVASVDSCPRVSRKKVYTLIRRHYVCKSSPDLSRHISVLLDPSGKLKPYQFIQYRFAGEEHSVEVKPHGNAKKTLRPYKRTCPSTLKDLKEELQQHPPKRAVFKVEQRRGGFLNVSCVGELPRNSLQASRIKCKNTSTMQSKPDDPLQALVVKFKEQYGSLNQFIQSIHLVPDPSIVLFNESQLSDMDHFCTSLERPSVLGLDVTFNLGKFYVTLCTYQNHNVVNDRGKNPIMIGPALLHSSKDQSNFSILFQEITTKKPKLATALRAYGTDGEQALSNAAADAFPFAIHLRCTNHLKDNITMHLRKQLLPECVVKEILSDIFGTATEKGLVHASNQDFDDKMKLMQKRWNKLEKQYKPTPVVFKWFAANMASIIRENVRSELLQELGLEEERYTQNNSESLNALVKRFVNFQKQDLFQFVSDLEECVQEQQNEVRKAANGLGRWLPSASRSHIELPSPCSSHIEQDVRSRFKSQSADDKQDKSSLLSTTSLVDNRLEKSRDADFIDDSLSVPYTSVTHILSESLMKLMWKKASRLLNEKKVIKAPGGNPKTRWVSSDTASSPHVVTTSKANPTRYTCDKQCVGWRAHNICAHCIATAEDNNELQDFLTWFTASKGKKSNLTNAVYHGTYKHAGLKKPPRRRYGDATHLPAEQKADRLALSDISNLDTVGTQLPPDQSNYVIGQGNSKDTRSQSTVSSTKQPSGTPYMAIPGQENPHNIPATVAGVSGNLRVNLGKSIQVCSTAQSVGTINVSASSVPSVTTPCPNTSVVSLLSQITLPSCQPSSGTMTSCASQNSLQSLLQSLATPGATGSCISQISLPSLLQSFTTPGGGVTSSTSQISLPSLLQSLTSPGDPGASTSVNSMKPATLKSNHPFLNQARAGRRPARAWFLEITLVRTSVCVFVYVCVCVSAPQAMKNYTREMKPE